MQIKTLHVMLNFMVVLLLFTLGGLCLAPMRKGHDCRINYVKKFPSKKVAHWDANNMQKLSRACLATA
jgi:hypothetical protein